MTIPCGTSTRQFLATVLKSETVASFPLHVTLDVSRGDISTPDLSLLDMDLATAVQSAHFDEEWAVQPERAIMGAKKICLVPFDFPLDRLQSIVFPSGISETFPGMSSTPSLLRDEPSLLREDGFFTDGATPTEPRARPRSFSPMPRVEADEPDGAGRLSFYIGERAANLVRGIEKLLSSGFYFSYDIDFSRTLQHRALESASTNLSSRPQMLPCWRAVQTENVDPPPKYILEMERTRLNEPSYVDCWKRQYLWNHHLVTPFIKAGVDLNWLVPITQGSVSSLFVEHPLHSVEMILICRRSMRRGGTRYNHRGIDDEGHVANFCETETILHVGRMRPETLVPLHRESMQQGASLPPGCGWAASVQIRGSVPLHWEQNGMIINPPPVLTKTYKDSPQSFKIHHDELARQYGDVYYMNLLSTTRQQEPRLTKSLVEALRLYTTSEQRNYERVKQTDEGGRPPTIQHTNWDFHSQVKAKGLEGALETLYRSEFTQQALYASGAFVERPLWTSGDTFQCQAGVIRTNCLDCLDRTNALQMYVAFWWLSAYLGERGLKNICVAPAMKMMEVQGTPLKVKNSVVGQLSAKDVIFTYFGGQEAPCALTAYRPIVYDKHLFFNEDDSSFVPSALREQLGSVWADHGDKISYAYTGTGSVLSALIKNGKASWSTNADHVFRSIGRLYQNTFEDNFRQECLQVLLNWTPCTPAAPRRTTKSLPPSKVASCNKEERDRLLIWTGTYNVAGKSPGEQDQPGLREWLMVDKVLADVYVVCIQELVELTGVRVLLQQSDKDKEWSLEFALRMALGPNYLKVRSRGLVGLYLTVFVRDTVVEQMSNLSIEEIKLGFRGQMGNKGAVLFRCNVGRESYVFGNVHLTPGTSRFDERRMQLRSVIRQAFKTATADDSVDSDSGVPESTRDTSDVDVLILGGDFNFRPDVSMDSERVIRMVLNGQSRDLFTRDQLAICRRLHMPPMMDLIDVSELNSSEIALTQQFPPTYKYIIRSNAFEKSRVPAWCDRVLLGGRSVDCEVPSNSQVECRAYSSVQTLQMSDHRPVMALVSCPFTPISPTYQMT
ncbi:MAG: uncharacterized protein KVP18_003339 [Porospora cf. gigantea A]|uniref:uncharacterized protein n=2 Tax=Porospora cf. gigantea A TaxID=2853593 RepID=UPI00355A050D|nr:MAG: hypothetical protein KVP18_003339 [Porospora cf. gigantea A]